MSAAFVTKKKYLELKLPPTSKKQLNHIFLGQKKELKLLSLFTEAILPELVSKKQ